MSIVVTLQKGIRVGAITHIEAELRPASAWDVIQATIDSERVVMVPSGLTPEGTQVMTPQLVPSPTNVGVNVLLRRIVRIGGIMAPIDPVHLEVLSPEDFNIMQRAAESYDKASLEVAQQGRSDSAGEGTA